MSEPRQITITQRVPWGSWTENYTYKCTDAWGDERIESGIIVRHPWWRRAMFALKWYFWHTPRAWFYFRVLGRSYMKVWP